MIECSIDKVNLNRVKDKVTLMLDGWCYSDNVDITEISCKIKGRDFHQITVNSRKDVHDALGLSSGIRVIGFSFCIQEDSSFFDEGVLLEIHAGNECREIEVSAADLSNNTVDNSLIANVEGISFDSVSGTAVI